MLNLASYFFKSFGSLFWILKRMLIVVFVLSAIISSFLYFSKDYKVNTNPKAFIDYQNEKIYGPINDPSLTKTDQGKIMAVIYRSTLCGLFGETCTSDPQEADKYKNSSLFGSVTGWISAPYNSPPASGLAWTQEGLASSGLIPQAYAAEGVGFSSIKGFMYVWTAFRNIALLLLVIITIVIGFLIMFRAKLGGQTAISLETILPRIVVTMIYISFSFAIAGFLIDMMYLFIGLAVDILLGYGLNLPIEYVARVQDDFLGAKFLDLWPEGSIWGSPFYGGKTYSAFGVGRALWNFIPAGFKTILDLVLIRTTAAFFATTVLKKWIPLLDSASNVGVTGGALTLIAGFNIGHSVSGIVKWVLTMLVTGIFTWIIPSLILGFIIILTILLYMFKVFFILIASYIKIMLYIMFAPIIILFEVIPGQNAFGWWFKNLMGELAAFPTVVVIMLAGQTIMMVNHPNFLRFGDSYTTNGQDLFPFTLPFLYGFKPEDFNMIVALGIILITPDFIKIVKGWIGVKDSSPLNFGLGTFFAGAGMFMSGIGTASNLESYKHTLVGSSPLEPQKGFLHWVGLGPLADSIRSKGTLPTPKKSST